MKLLNIDWEQFFSALELYRKLPEKARKRFIEEVRPSQPISKKLLEPWGPAFVETGLMAFGATGVNASVKPEHREFSRAIRAMSRARVFEVPSRESFLDYLNDNLTSSEMAALGGSYLFGRLGHQEIEKLYSTVCATSWTRQFLAARNVNWERDYADPAQPRYFTSDELLNATQQLVRAVVAENGLVPMERLPALCPGLSAERLSGAMRAALRYLLLFPALRAGDLEPVAGLWPGIADKLSNKPLPTPQPVAVSEPFRSPFLMDDMIALLSACAADPVRLRSGDMQIFEADRKKIAEGLGSLPEWMERAFNITAEIRIARALEFLIHFGFVDRLGRPGSNLRLAVTEDGARWLGQKPKQRIRLLLDGLRGALKNENSLYEGSVMSMLPGILSMGSRSQSASLVPAVLKAFAGVPEGAFLRLSEFLAYQARTNNAVSAIVAKDRYFSLRIGSAYISSPSEEEADQAWQNLLFGFINLRLLPLGGGQLGIEDGGNAICFSLTDPGRYLIGVANDFEMAADAEARILVQPNFDVVFLAPSARLEAELGRFCERKGRHIGTLFRITKNSILNAAASGMTVSQVLERLREYSPADIPANVSSEITGWFRRFRQVNVRPATILHCPDEETAATVVAILAKKVTPLTSTVLELHETKVQPAIAKKLRDMGIFVRASGQPVF